MKTAALCCAALACAVLFSMFKPNSPVIWISHVTPTHLGDFRTVEEAALGELRLHGWPGTPCQNLIPLSSASPFRIAVTGGIPFRKAWLVIGSSKLDDFSGALWAPFKQGLMFPRPDAIHAITLDQSGEWISGPLDVPGVEPYTAMFSQVWMKDTAAPAGWWGSNGLVATFSDARWPHVSAPDNDYDYVGCDWP